MTTDKEKTYFEKWLAEASAVTSSSQASPLVALLELFHQQTRTGKGAVLALFRDKPDHLAYPVLEQALRNDENANLRNTAMEIYCALGGRSSLPLRALLHDTDEEIRNFACVMLGNIGNRQAVPDLITALTDPDLNVKHAAAEALGKIKDPGAVDALIDALGTDMWLQFPVTVTLGDIGDARAVQPLIELLPLAGVNVPAIQALGKIGDPAALAPLCTFLEDDEPSLREWALEAVARVLAKNPAQADKTVLSNKSRNLLIETLRSDSLKSRRNAVFVLGRVRVAPAASALVRFFADRDLREDAVEAIIRIGGDSALAELAVRVNDRDPLVRRAAVHTLGGLGTARSLKPILPALSDSVEEVRSEAALALARFNSDEARGALAGALADISGATAEAEKKLLDAYAAITGTNAATAGFDPADVFPLRDYISEKLGLHYDDERLHVLYHRLSPLAAAGGFQSLREFHRYLLDHPGSAETLNKIASQLTNNETYFFRETGQLQVFLRTLLPEILGKKKGARRPALRFFSAGCSSGEEAYTLAILLEEAGMSSQGCDIEIMGMDIDHSVLNIARRANYSANSFRKDERGMVKKYFHVEDDGFFLNYSVRDRVKFVQGNILESGDLGRFDVIFCRNVLIYFSDNSMERAAKNFYNMLLPGGYLLLGHSESFYRIETDFVPVRLEGAVVYQKQ